MAQAQTTPRPRKDPARRPLNGLTPWNEVVNQDPDFRYVLVSPEAREMGPEYYEMLGYEYVTYQGDKAPRLAAGKHREGEKIVSMGQYLMCIRNDAYAQLNQYGANGQSGQELLDQISSSMLDRHRGGINPVQGRGGIHASQLSSNNADEDLSDYLK